VEQAALNHHDEIVEPEPYNALGESVKGEVNSPRIFMDATIRRIHENPWSLL
jgi:hypothetical protein